MWKGDAEGKLEHSVAHKQKWSYGRMDTISIWNFGCMYQEIQHKLQEKKKRKCNCSKIGKSIISPGPSLSSSGGSHGMVSREAETSLHQPKTIVLHPINSNWVYRPIPEVICGIWRVCRSHSHAPSWEWWMTPPDSAKIHGPRTGEGGPWRGIRRRVKGQQHYLSTANFSLSPSFFVKWC